MTDTLRMDAGHAVLPSTEELLTRLTAARTAETAAAPATPEPAAAPAPVAPVAPEPASFNLDQLAAAVADRVTVTREPHPLARFRTAGELHTAVREGRAVVQRSREGIPSAEFALVNQITGDNPGLKQPQWLSDIVGIIDLGRPSVTAFGTAALTSAPVYWPVYGGDLKLIVAEQLTEKAEINSVKVSFTQGSATPKTYAGGSDISYQLLMLSTPAYLEAYDRVLVAGYAATTGATFSAAVTAGATGTIAATASTAEAIAAAVFGASVKVNRATGSPASFVLAADDIYPKLAGVLQSSAYPVQNTGGVANASNLAMSLSGIAVINDPYLAAGTVLASNSAAASWFEAGPYFAGAEDVAHLGRDVAVWGLGAPAIRIPTGIVKITGVVLPFLAAANEPKSDKGK